MANEKELRQALNQFTVVGTLKENNLELKDDLIDRYTNEKYKAMVGELVVKVGDSNEHRLSFFAREMTKAGEVSKLFTAYKTIMETYMSMTDIKLKEENKEDTEGLYPTRLQVQGEIGVNDYVTNGELKTFPQLSGKFVNSVKQGEEDKAQFDLELYINKLSSEMDKDGIETNRLKVSGVIPIYGGKVIPSDLTVTDEYGVADYMLMNFAEGDTIKVWGDIYNSAVEKKKEKSGFGKARDTITIDYKREMLIIGGEEAPLEDDKAFSPDAIKIALQERENYLEGKLSGGGKPSGRTAGFGGQAKKKVAPKRDISVGDIPF